MLVSFALIISSLTGVGSIVGDVVGDGVVTVVGDGVGLVVGTLVGDGVQST